MNRYVLRFYKRGNMRFISHLDLGRLFKRAIRKAGIAIAFSNGYNPHELINIVQPLSLGYESESEYFEIDTLTPYDPLQLAGSLNEAMPDGISFFACREIDRSSKNLSYFTQYAVYKVLFPWTKPAEADEKRPETTDLDEKLREFLSQESIIIIKKDKKTKKPVEKDIKAYIQGFELCGHESGMQEARMVLRCASNETLNPGKLLESFFAFCGTNTGLEDCRFVRLDLLAYNRDGRLVSLYEAK